MARWCGVVGYATTVETTPGVWEEQYDERRYFGDVIRASRRLESSGDLNDDVNVSNEISIVADPFAINHFHTMRYVELNGTKWKITSVEIQYPRLKLTVGGVFNA